MFRLLFRGWYKLSRGRKVQTRIGNKLNNAPAQSQTFSLNKDADEVLKKYEQELTKQLLSNSVEFIRTTSQQLQTISSILLSSYTAIFFGLGKQFGLPKNVPTWVYSIPILFFTASLIVSFVIALLSKTSTSSPGDWESAENAFTANLKRRQEQMYIPAFLSALGLISFAGIAILAW